MKVVMDDKTLLDVLSKSLDVVSITMYLIVPIGLVVLWAALFRKTIKVGNVELELSNGFLPILFTFAGGNLVIIFNIVQLGSALERLSTASLREGMTRIWYHSWALNPFCYFGDSGPETVTCLFGYGSLIVAWWVCFLATFSLLSFNRVAKGRRLWLLLPIAEGVASMAAIARTYKIMLARGGGVRDLPIESFRTSVAARETVVIIAIGVGVLVFVAVENRVLRNAGMQRLGFSAILKLVSVAGASISGPMITLAVTSLVTAAITLGLIPWIKFFYGQRYWLLAIFGFAIFGLYLIFDRPVEQAQFTEEYERLKKENYLD